MVRLSHTFGLLGLGLVLGCTEPEPIAPAARLSLASPVGGHGATARLWRGGGQPAASGDPVVAAREHVTRLAPDWGVAGPLPALTARGTVDVIGGRVVRLAQELDGVAIDGGELRVMVGDDGALIAASGLPASAAWPRAATIAIDAAGAVRRALGVAATDRDLGGVTVDGDGATWFAGDPTSAVGLDRARARRVWHRAGAHLEAAWVVEAFTTRGTDGDAIRTVVSAVDGRILERRDLTDAAEFAYRVWADPSDRYPADGPLADFSPHPSGVPDGTRPTAAAPALVRVDGLNHNAGGAADPWLAAGATSTRGNNADAYVDLNAPDGLSAGDFRASTTTAGTFDRTYALTVGPLANSTQQMASVTALFYQLNWLHDDWYDAGFTEATGNAQVDNFGRGGVGGDPIHGEAQDDALNGTRDNARMATPDDGMSPRMEVYLWSAPSVGTLTLNPGGGRATGTAGFGSTTFNLTGQVVAASDGSGATTDACQAITNNVSGRIALVDRGSCSFESKAQRAQAAGAIGIIIANNTGTGAMNMPEDAMVAGVTIAAASLSMADGQALRAALGAGAVSVTLTRTTGVEADAALDAGLVAHEFGHYVHHRLSLCGTRMCGAMSEGWGDFVALHMLARPGDGLATGTWGLSTYANGAGDPYFGIRRFPYSVDKTKNALSFRHMANGVTLPSNPNNDNGIPNSEVHNAGEVWATMMWEAYVALHQANPTVAFDELRRRMSRYVVAGLLMAPPDATLTEMRDALLIAARTGSVADHDTMAAAFARRGAGSCAVSPPRDSTDFAGIVESDQVQGNAVIGDIAVALDDDCDADGVIDAGDHGMVTVTIHNDGARALTDAVVTLRSSTPGLTVEGPPVTIALLDEGAAATATFAVALGAATGPLEGELTATVAVESGACVPERIQVLAVRMNVDDRATSSATDGFDAPSVWTLGGIGPERAWVQEQVTALDRQWRGRDLGAPSDTALVSPPLTAGSGPVTISFDHRFGFEADATDNYDGGFIEFSTDAGATWTDISSLAAPGYGGVITDQSNNPEAGRQAFVGTNPSSPGTDRVTLALGTALAGRTFQLRFRIVTDAAVGGPGWEIDDLVTTGLGMPFPVQVGDIACGASPDAGTDPGGDDGGCCGTGRGDGRGALGLGLMVAIALVRRRATSARRRTADRVG